VGEPRGEVIGELAGEEGTAAGEDSLVVLVVQEGG